MYNSLRLLNATRLEVNDPHDLPTMESAVNSGTGSQQLDGKCNYFLPNYNKTGRTKPSKVQLANSKFFSLKNYYF